MSVNGLGRMSLKELRALRDRVDAAIAEREHQDRAEVKAKLSQVAAKAGYSVGELFGGGRGGKKAAATIKYRNPKDPSQTWTGRGRKPNWIVAAGGDIERFRV